MRARVTARARARARGDCVLYTVYTLTLFDLCIQVTLPSGKKVASRVEAIDEKLRLDTQMLLDQANAISSALDGADGASWGQKPHWQPFLKDALNLALALDKLGEGGLAQARRVRANAVRTASPHTPQHTDSLKLKVILAQLPTEPKRFAQLTSILEDAEEYEPVRILDHHMGISRLTATPSTVRRAFYSDMSFANFNVKRYKFAQGGPYPRCALSPQHLKPLYALLKVSTAVVPPSPPPPSPPPSPDHR